MKDYDGVRSGGGRGVFFWRRAAGGGVSAIEGVSLEGK